MLYRMELKVDKVDYDAIQEAIAIRQRWGGIPDSDDPENNLTGRLVAEVCRGFIDMFFAGGRDGNDGDEWKSL